MYIALLAITALAQQDGFQSAGPLNVLAFLSPSTQTPLDALKKAHTGQELMKAADDLGWFYLSDEKTAIVVDDSLLGLRSLQLQADIARSLAESRDSQIDVEKMPEPQRKALIGYLSQMRPDWTPLFNSGNLKLRFQPSAQMYFGASGSHYGHMMELPLHLAPPPRYGNEQRLAPGTNLPGSNRPTGTLSAMPEDFRVRVLTHEDPDSWVTVPEALSIVRHKFDEMRQQYYAALESFLRNSLGTKDAEALLAAKSPNDLPSLIGEQFKNDLIARGAAYGISGASSYESWASGVSIEKVHLMMFAEFSYEDELGNSVRVSIGLPCPTRED